MSRHVVRSLLIWFTALPIVLAGSMAPRNCALWVAAVAYIFVGIEEVGVQVEQVTLGTVSSSSLPDLLLLLLIFSFRPRSLLISTSPPLLLAAL